MVYYHEAGLVGDPGWVWIGLIADIALCCLASVVFTLLWSMVAQYAKAKVDEESL
jgi:hypothetical protein